MPFTAIEKFVSTKNSRKKVQQLLKMNKFASYLTFFRNLSSHQFTVHSWTHGLEGQPLLLSHWLQKKQPAKPIFCTKKSDIKILLCLAPLKEQRAEQKPRRIDQWSPGVAGPAGDQRKIPRRKILDEKPPRTCDYL